MGYARVSTEDQNLQAQIAQLQQDGCARIFKEKLTGTTGRQPGLDRALVALQPGDTLVVWKLDRLGRSVKHLAATLEELQDRGIGFRSISDGIDTQTPAGRLLYHLLSAIAEFEAKLISERTKLSLGEVRRRGGRLGRPQRMGAREVKRARQLRARNMSYDAIAQQLKVGRTTLWRAMREPHP